MLLAPHLGQLPAMQILFGWEMGAGMGHLKSHRELFLALGQQGHTVHVASRDVAKAARAFEGMNLPIWQAPFGTEKPEPLYSMTPTMAQVLHNSGLTRIDNVIARTRAWDLLIDTIRPALVLIDSAPTLQLALRGKDLPAASLSTGFFVPPDVHPLPLYSTLQETRFPPQIPTRDTATLAALNAVLAARKQPPLRSIAALYNEGVLPLLVTVPDLDHYPDRRGGCYVGLPASPPGEAPEWPDVSGPRIYAYLKPFKRIEKLLAELRATEFPTIVVSDGIPETLHARYRSRALSFSKRALDLSQVTQSCLVGVNNANHGTVGHFLLHGVPVLMIPLFLEQEILAARVVKQNTGISLRTDQCSEVLPSLRRLLDECEFADSAKSFAARQAKIVQAGQVSLLLGHLERIARR